MLVENGKWIRYFGVFFLSFTIVGFLAVTSSRSLSSPYKEMTDLLLEEDAEVARKWYGGETFCVFGKHAETESLRLNNFLQALNRAYDIDFKIVVVTDAVECPWFTTFYALFNGPVNHVDLAKVMTDISGDEPPMELLLEMSSVSGFSISVPGSRSREFFYVDTESSAVSSNPDPVQSIMIEEVFHSIIELPERATNKIISVLGEDFSVSSYDDWFEKNPTGLCLLDLYLLELALGSTEYRTDPVKWVEDRVGDIQGTGLRSQLDEFLDVRCLP